MVTSTEENNCQHWQLADSSGDEAGDSIVRGIVMKDATDFVMCYEAIAEGRGQTPTEVFHARAGPYRSRILVLLPTFLCTSFRVGHGNSALVARPAGPPARRPCGWQLIAPIGGPSSFPKSAAKHLDAGSRAPQDKGN